MAKDWIPKSKQWAPPQHEHEFIRVERVGPYGHRFIVLACKICGYEYVSKPGWR